MGIPKVLEHGIHKGKVHCTQYACLNNYGVQKGYIHHAEYPSGCCRLENPRYEDFDNSVWGCSDEEYPNEKRI